MKYKEVDMPNVQKSLRMPDTLIKSIEEIAMETKKDFTTTANELLEEAIKTHQCPGIVFTEGVNGKRAKIAGTGIEVWEVISTYKSVEKNVKRLVQAYHWLTEHQINSALGYYRIYSNEINDLIEKNESWGIQSLQKKYPFLPAGKN
jgi:uncharacterized protein (DUF433 family)